MGRLTGTAIVAIYTTKDKFMSPNQKVCGYLGGFTESGFLITNLAIAMRFVQTR